MASNCLSIGDTRHCRRKTDWLISAGIRIVFPGFWSDSAVQSAIRSGAFCVGRVMADKAFITSLSLNARSESKSDKLCQVRRDHDQLIDIVKKFGSKVSIM